MRSDFLLRSATQETKISSRFHQNFQEEFQVYIFMHCKISFDHHHHYYHQWGEKKMCSEFDFKNSEVVPFYFGDETGSSQQTGCVRLPLGLKESCSSKIFKVYGYKKWLKELLTRFEKETCRILWAQEEAEVKKKKKKSNRNPNILKKEKKKKKKAKESATVLNVTG